MLEFTVLFGRLAREPAAIIQASSYQRRHVAEAIPLLL